ncbi:hypothetical protein [Cellulomonas sp. Leaf395]|uniref:hypothetical protein n=1 Tax=Cellulomonas sp. Leaf395 TaxID=1736362 RepID=UPI0006F52864|nr:hypothetical protein [Cellulomonas sp. Leaf395]KQS97313.1 hypothetical protein ASG23_17335 [Cellulomonas sp. Leaf395]
MSGHPGASSAVFVDPSGRRGRTVRRITWALGALVATYAVLVVAALVVPVGMNRLAVPGLGPLLPGPIAPALAGTAGDPTPPAPAPPSPTATPTPSPSASASAREARTVPATPAPTPAAILAAAPPPVPSATPTQAARGPSVAAPGQTDDQPGNAPTAKPEPAKPEPASTHAATPTPRPNKG